MSEVRDKPPIRLDRRAYDAEYRTRPGVKERRHAQKKARQAALEKLAQRHPTEYRALLLAEGQKRGVGATRSTPAAVVDRAQLAATLKHDYENGTSIRALAKREQRSYGFIRDLLHEAGTELRQRGGS